MPIPRLSWDEVDRDPATVWKRLVPGDQAQNQVVQSISYLVNAVSVAAYPNGAKISPYVACISWES